jgi:hypothetical protein
MIGGCLIHKSKHDINGPTGVESKSIATPIKNPSLTEGFLIGVPTGIRTPVLSVKGRCPRPLDDGNASAENGRKTETVV